MKRDSIDNTDEIVKYLRECKELEFIGSTKIEIIENRIEYIKKCMSSFSMMEFVGVTGGYYNSDIDTVFVFKFSQKSKQSFIFTLLHEIRHIYQDRVQKVSYEEYRKSSKTFETDSNIFAYNFIVNNNKELSSKLGMVYDAHKLAKVLSSTHI